MIREFLILNVLLVLTTCRVVTNDSRKTRNSDVKIYLNKCCPMGTYVGQSKTCVNYTTTQILSKIKIYDEDINHTGKSFQDVFTLIANKFDNKTFKNYALNIIKLGVNVYLTESGVVQLEFPNKYYRWKAIPKDEYCIDADSDDIDSELQFWILIYNRHEKSSSSKPYLPVFGMLISCFFMLLVLIVYLLLPELRNLCGMILMAYVSSLFMAFLLLIVTEMAVATQYTCIGLTSAVYFFVLATFCWMNVMSYDIWWTFRSILKVPPASRQEDRFKFLVYCLYAWGVPLAMTVGLNVVNTFQDHMRHLPWFITPGIPRNGCFLHGGEKLLYLYIPMLILIVCNWTFYLMTAVNIWRVNRETAVLDSVAACNQQAHRNQKQRFMVFLKLSIVMGLDWLMEIVSSLCPDYYYIWYISDAYNILIGLAMFLVFIFKKKIWKKLCKRYMRNNTIRWNPSSESHSLSKIDSGQDSQEDFTLRSEVSSPPNRLN